MVELFAPLDGLQRTHRYEISLTGEETLRWARNTGWIGSKIAGKHLHAKIDANGLAEIWVDHEAADDEIAAGEVETIIGDTLKRIAANSNPDRKRESRACLKLWPVWEDYRHGE